MHVPPGQRKILYVITRSHWGGAQRYVYDLATNLPRESFDVAVACGGNGPLMTRLREAGIRTLGVPRLERDVGVGRELATAVALLRLFRREAPDIIHLNGSKAAGLGAVAGRIAGILNRKRPLIAFTIHGWAFAEDRPWWQRWLIWFASCLGAFFQDRIITITSSDDRAARRFIPQRKLVFIAHGLAPFTLLARAEARARIAAAVGRRIEPGSLLVGTIAELVRNKGLRFLIAAASILERELRGHPAHIVIIGEGVLRPELEALIRERALEAIVSLPGFVPDARRLLSAFDIFALPSLKEGLPYALMEAMAAGLPIVASRVGGIPDLVEDGTSAILVPAKDPQAIAAAVIRLLGDSDARLSLAAAARRRVAGAFGLRVMVETTLAVYASQPITGSPAPFR